MASSPAELFQSFCIMLIMWIIGFVLIFAVSAPTDDVFNGFNSSGLTGNAGNYDSRDDISYLRDLIVVVSYALFIVGVAQFIFICVRKADYNTVYSR